jgi:type I restriction enzyme M protein
MARGRKPKAEGQTASTKTKKANGANVGFEAELFQAADKLRKNLEPSEYKHVVLGLIFLKYISDAFEAHRELLLQTPGADIEDTDEYLQENVFWAPQESRWERLRDNARLPDIGKRIDDAMTALEKYNASLKGVLPKDYVRPALDSIMLGQLLALISNIPTQQAAGADKDLLGRIYEYFLSGFAGAEGRRGGEFFTPLSVVNLLVAMLEPMDGRVLDPCCGSGGMFVQSTEFAMNHGKRFDSLSIYGQESNLTTWRLCKMNLAVRHVDSTNVVWNNEGSFHKDAHPDLRADHVLANPPFNVSDWGGERLTDDARWKYGAPPAGNANFAWLQHILHHLAPKGTGGVVLANGAMSSTASGEGEIRKAMVEGDVVDCMVALPGQLFYSTQIPACLWFLAKDKNPGKGWRDRRGQILFIDARQLGHMADRTRREFSKDDIDRIAGAYHAWRGGADAKPYEDVPGFCKVATLAEIREHGHILTPGRYVGVTETEDDGIPFAEKMAALTATLQEQMAESCKLDAAILKNLAALGFRKEERQ